MTPQVWRGSDADELIRHARQHEAALPSGARERVWRALRRAQARPTARSWPGFLAGAALACAALLCVSIALRQPSTAASSFAPGMLLPTSFVEMRGNGELVVGRGSRVLVDRYDEQEVDLRVQTGSLLVHVLPRTDRGPFVVRTPRFVARVIGTVFRVVVDASGESSIAVAHGTVEVSPEGQPLLLVHARETWPPSANAAPAADELARLPLASREEVVPSDFATPRAHACRGDPEARLRCELAFAQEAPSAEAENALYRAGLIAWKELGDARRALALWRQQRERFPNGVLRREVQASVIDALVATRSEREAEAAIESYLAVEPDDLRASELHFVLATIQRQLDGSCRRAAGELDLALSHPNGAWVSKALEARRACGSSR